MNPGGRSPEAEARLARLAADGDGDLPLPDLADRAVVGHWRRAQHEAWGEDGAPGEAAHDPGTVAGVPVLRAGPVDGPPLLYLHGGGFCLGSAGTVRPITARLAAAGLAVTSVSYRLAPEHPHPAGLDDAAAVHRALAADDRPPMLAGDSAGANLALGLALRLGADTVAGAPPTVLFSPVLDLRDHRAGGESAALAEMVDAHLGTADPADPEVSPLAASDGALASLGPLLLQTTDGERLHPQAVRFQERALAAGVDSTLQVWAGLWHAWHYHRELPEAHVAVDTAAAWLVDRAGRADLSG